MGRHKDNECLNNTEKVDCAMKIEHSNIISASTNTTGNLVSFKMSRNV